MDSNKHHSTLRGVLAACSMCLPHSCLHYKVAASVAECRLSHVGACWWLPPPPLYSYIHRALTFRLHSANTYRLHLPAYMKDVYPATLSPTSVVCLLTPHSPFPCCSGVATICSVSRGRHWGCYFFRSGFCSAPSHTAFRVCLRSCLADMGLHHCHLVAGGTVTSSYETFPHFCSLIGWQFNTRDANIGYDRLKPMIDFILVTG